VIARVPGSSANVGPGFDTLALAVSLYVEIGNMADVDGAPEGARAIDHHHPASIAFARSGGRGDLWERGSIPSGRGLGFSGAVRVAGALLADAQQTGASEIDDSVRHRVFPLVSALEGHADNVAASLFGGMVATADGRVVRVPLGVDPAVVVWIPSFATKTDESRRALATSVPFDDAVFNIGRVAMLVAALGSGDVDSLALATQDRLHQPTRLARSSASREAMDAVLQAGAWCSWLSGSGPTVAALCPRADAAAIAAELSAALADEGVAKVLRLDHEGATIEGSYT
jgi:homoserine kinase